MNSAKIRVWVALLIMLIAIAAFAGYFLQSKKAVANIRDMTAESSLLDIYKTNQDMVGWIRIPNTDISYPVMCSENYLHKDFKKNYAYRGTPFVMNGWDEESINTMIYGHNMWVEHTMFNPLHEYKDENFYKDHPEAEFFVIQNRGKGEDELYVEKRTYRIHAVDLVDIREELYQNASTAEDEEDARNLFSLANQESLYQTGTIKYGDELILCTCSYHLKDRDAGRILVFGTRTNTEKKDMY